jgi:two-component system sensor histidine kinase MprB
MSFRRRLALIAAAAVAVAAVLGSVVAYVVVSDTLHAQIDNSLRERARAPGVQKVPPLPGQRGLFQQLESPQVATQTLVLVEGISRPDRGRLDEIVDRAALDELASGQRDAFFTEREIAGVHARVFATADPAGNVMVVARPLTEVDHALSNLRLGLGLACLGGIGLAVLLAWLGTRTAVRPVTQLTETAEHVTRTRDLSLRIDAGGDDELARLATSFNTMLEALESSRRAQRQLVADASHELRTPLTSLRTNLEVLGRADALSPGDRERLRASVVSQIEELTDLVADLIELAREEEPRAEPPEDVRLDALVLRAVERARRHRPEARVETDLEPAVVSGVPARLDRAVANLLDNAAKWSPAGAAVEVRLRGGELTVRDHGPGIAPEDLPHVFDRFYRSAQARGAAGSGLGLAIVRQVAETHGGTVAAEAAPGGGALLRLTLPAIPAALPAGVS